MRDSARVRLANHASSRRSEPVSAGTDRAAAAAPVVTSNATHSEPVGPSLKRRTVHLSRPMNTSIAAPRPRLLITPRHQRGSRKVRSARVPLGGGQECHPLRVRHATIQTANDPLEAPGAVQRCWMVHMKNNLTERRPTKLDREDITEPKRAENAAELRQLVDVIPQQVYVFGPDWTPLFANQRERDYLGLTLETAKSKEAFASRVHPEDLKKLEEIRERALLEPGSFELEARIKGKDGNYRWFLIQDNPLLDEQGRVLRWFVTRTDIEDRKRAEEAQRRIEAYLSSAQSLSHTGSWAFSAEGFDYWSSELFQIHGLDAGGRAPSTEEYLMLVHPDDREFVARTIRKMLADHRGFDFIKRIVRPDGDIRYVRCVGSPVTHRAMSQGFIGSAVDVTEQEHLTEALRRSEFYLAEGQRLGHAGSWAFNPGGYFDHWSQELFQIYGLDPQQGAPTLERYLATIHPQDRDFMAETIKRMRVQGSGCDVKKRIIRPDGALRHIRCVGIPFLENGVLKGFLGTAM